MTDPINKEQDKYPLGSPKRIEQEANKESAEEWIPHATNPHVSVHRKSGRMRTDDFDKHVQPVVKSAPIVPSASDAEPDLYDGFLVGDSYDQEF